MSQSTQSRRDVLALLGSAAAFALAPQAHAAEAPSNTPEIDEFPYAVADEPWQSLLGNHRGHVYTDKPGAAVWAHLPWRRTDENPEQKAVLVYDEHGNEVLNVAIPSLEDEYGDLVFEAKQAGSFFIYYLPHEELKGRQSVLGPKGQYRKPLDRADASWASKYGAASQRILQALPKARVVAFEARTALDSFYPMLVPATRSEAQQLCQEHPQAVLLFPEDREHPIQMDDRLPSRWLRSGPGNHFSGTALRGEFYVLQVGVYLPGSSPLTGASVSTRFAEFTGPGNETIPASAWSCINTDIVDVHGTPSRRKVKVERGKIAPLWCGLQIPLDAKPGQYSGRLFVIANGEELPIAVDLTIQRDFIRAGGADQGWRLARIAWLNSKIGLEDSVTAPYTALQMHGDTIQCLGREIRLGETGFPVSVRANGKELLASPVVLSINGQPITSKGTSAIESASDAKIVIASSAKSGPYTLRVRTTVEFDGGAGFDVTLSSEQSRSVSGVALEMAFPKEAVPYSVGMGLKGGARPQSWQWKWSEQPQRWKDQGSNLEYFLWMGDVDAGLYCRLTSPLNDWINGANGSVSFAETNGQVRLHATSGARRIRANEEMHYSFRLLPTPVKPIDPNHWKYRYAHAYQPPAELHALEATVNNIHQGTLPNMYINYPFLNLDLLGPYISESHALGMKVKIYYTMRELSTRLPELWTFRSLGDEIYRIGGTQGQGNPQLDFWLQEHLRHEYSPGWITLTPTGDIDTSLRVYSGSRLANFYLEGLKWLLRNVPIDGLYLDEIGYSRATMQRVRRVLEQRPGAMIDMHGNHDWWSCNCPIGYYMEHLPYIDRLWLGEGFNPDSPPDFWLIEMSGIPFGLSSDLLEKPNLWRCMLFGMTNRALYSGPLPTPIWKLWDNFGIEDATMLGWWNKDVPVTTRRKDVLATVYRKPGKSMIAIASWADRTVSVQLDIDWPALGLEKQRAKLSAPDMGYFQSAHNFSVDQAISIPAGKGCLLILEQD